jgi:CheY-like chemotaxis protein
MSAPILVSGLDGRGLLLEAPLLLRDGHSIEERESVRALLEGVAETGSRLVVVGPRLADGHWIEAIRRIRSSPKTREVSILAIVPSAEPVEGDMEAIAAGANAVLRRPLEGQHLESWVAKLLAVPRRVEARIPVRGHVVGSERSPEAGHFFGLTRNLSIHGMLLASPVRLSGAQDLDLEFTVDESTARLQALGRIVRSASEVAWPYLGYGVEFLFTPPVTLDALSTLVAQMAVPPAQPLARSGIHSTLRRGPWVYELLAPVAHAAGWHVEIRRAPRDEWRAGAAGPFYVVEGSSPEAALQSAREFVHSFG